MSSSGDADNKIDSLIFSLMRTQDSIVEVAPKDIRSLSSIKQRATIVMQPPCFPLELLCPVIDELGLQQDISALKACSITCRALRTLSQRHLLSRIELPVQLARDAAEKLPSQFTIRLLDTLSANPALSGYVQSLKLKGTFAPATHAMDNRSDLKHDIIYLPIVLGKLPKLKTIVIEDIYAPFFPMQLIGNAFVTSARHLNLHTLVLHGVTDLASSFLSSFPNITTLDVSYVHFKSNKDNNNKTQIEPSALGRPRSRLTSLTIRRSQDLVLLDQLSHFYDLGHLRKLDISLCGRQFLQRLATLCSGSIVEHLSLDTGIESIPGLNLTKLTALRIRNALEGPSLVGSIRSFPSPARLTHLSLMIAFNKGKNALASQSRQSLTKLNELLPALRSLRALIIEFHGSLNLSRYEDLMMCIPNAERQNIHISLVTRRG